MSKLQQKDIEKIASLARLHPLADTDKQCDDFNKLLDMFAGIREVDTENITPLAHPLEDLSQPLREDIVTEQDQRARFQALAPAIEADVYLVPATFADGTNDSTAE